MYIFCIYFFLSYFLIYFTVIYSNVCPANYLKNLISAVSVLVSCCSIKSIPHPCSSLLAKLLPAAVPTTPRSNAGDYIVVGFFSHT